MSATRPAALALMLAAAPALAASLPECTCRNLTSLQQDYRNAEALEAYFTLLAEHLKAYEGGMSSQAPDRGLLGQLSLGEDQAYREENPPGQVMGPVEGYWGPAHVDMEPGKCIQRPEDLEAMDVGSPCRGMADAALNHEAAHRANCDRMGPENYWRQMPSEIALEEAENYRAQAAALKDELRRVLDAAEVTLSVDWTLEINAQDLALYGYSFSSRSEDIGGASGGDPWTMTGQGTSTGTWTKAVFAGMRCTPSGAITTEYEAKLTTDGLTFDLDLAELSTSGSVSIRCPGGGGGGGPVAEAGGAGNLAEGLPVKAGDNPLPGDMAEEMRALMAGAATVTGEGERVLSVTCEGP
ncbi:MAG: hypothetical protein OEM24_08765 [Paracoccaceae bacterium]|nr:hypothetical protein [Paracoccaceae bacterium]